MRCTPTTQASIFRVRVEWATLEGVLLQILGPTVQARVGWHVRHWIQCGRLWACPPATSCALLLECDLSH